MQSVLAAAVSLCYSGRTQGTVVVGCLLADIYSLAVVLWTMLTGKVQPWQVRPSSNLAFGVRVVCAAHSMAIPYVASLSRCLARLPPFPAVRRTTTTQR